MNDDLQKPARIKRPRIKPVAGPSSSKPLSPVDSPKPLGNPRQSSVMRSSLVMGLGTLLSRILGFIRWSLLIAAIAAMSANDAFQVANNMPNMVYNLLAAGLLDAILVPQIVRAFKTPDGSAYVNRLITLAGTVLFGITMVTLLGAAVLVNIFAAEMAPAWKSLAVVFSLWCLPQIFFYGLYNLLGETLNARGIFGPYTWVPVVNNLIGIAGLIIFIAVYGTATDVYDPTIWNFQRTALLAAPATLGVVVQALLLFIPLRRAGIKLRPDFHFKGAGLKSASKVGGWVFAVLLVNQVSVISTMNIGAAASAWREATEQFAPAVTAINFTYMIYMMPQSIIATSIAIVMFTRISNAAADNNMRQVAKDFHFGVRTTTILNLWAAAILGAGSVPIFQALAPLAGEEVVYSMALALTVMLPGLAAAAISMFASRVFFALEDGRPVFISVLGPTIVFVIVSWILKGLLPGYLWVIAVLFTEAVSRLVMAWLSLQLVKQRVPQVNKLRVIVDTCLYTIISLFTGLLTFGIMRVIGIYAPGESYLLQFLGAAWRGILIVCIVTFLYATLTAAFDRRGFNSLVGKFGKRVPAVQKFVQLIPQIPLPAVVQKLTSVAGKPLNESVFYATNHDADKAIWFADRLRIRSGFNPRKVATKSVTSSTTEAPAKLWQQWGEIVFEKLYQWSLWLQPAPVKHADPDLQVSPVHSNTPTAVVGIGETQKFGDRLREVGKLVADSSAASSEITIKNGVMVETLTRGTRSLAQSLEFARGTVAELQAGEKIDPTRPTIMLFAALTVLFALLAMVTLGVTALTGG